LTTIKSELFDSLYKEIENTNFPLSKRIKTKRKDIPHKTVHVDIEMIKSVFRNLINNTLKYLNINGEINATIIQIK